jgi:hypothetical protein
MTNVQKNNLSSKAEQSTPAELFSDLTDHFDGFSHRNLTDIANSLDHAIYLIVFGWQRSIKEEIPPELQFDTIHSLYQMRDYLNERLAKIKSDE